MKPMELKQQLLSGAFAKTFAWLYGDRAAIQQERYAEAVDQFAALFGDERDVRLFSAPGRTEVGGNHTDHQRGRVLAAGVNLDVIAVAALSDSGVISIQSKGYPRDIVAVDDLEEKEEERNHACSLVRGMASRFVQLGYKIGGLDAYTTSDVLSGSGLSSSAAFEVLIGNLLSGLYNGGAVSPIEIAQISQYAENVYFGKPSGLMDQMASSVGSFVTIDFKDTAKPVVEKVDFDFSHSDYNLCIVDTKGDHADLTPEYGAIPTEMRAVAACFGKEVLREVDEDEFYARLGDIHSKVSDRALVRAIHFFSDNARVPMQVAALRGGDFERFKELIIESGRSSAMYLQNVFASSDPEHQGLSVALSLSERMLAGCGAWRVHGGGFAGTIQAFVPDSKLEAYRAGIESVFGEGSCHVLSVRPVGGCEITADLADAQ